MSEHAAPQHRTASQAAPGWARPARAFSASRPAAHPLLAGQQALGNQAMQQLLRSGAIQAKLSVNEPGDHCEQEADRVAEQVMRMPAPGRAGAPAVAVSARPLSLQRMCAECREEERLQARELPGGAAEVTPEVEAQVDALRQGGQPLPASMRAFFAPRFGHDFSDVRIHTGSPAAEAALRVNARAYTLGRHIVFGAGQFAPETAAGQRLVAHELTHVLQQAAGPEPGVTLQRDSWDDEEAEDGGVLDWASQQVQSATDWATETGGEVAAQATEAGSAAVDWATQTGSEVVDWATQTGSEVVDWATTTGGEVVDWATQTGGEAMDWASQAASGPLEAAGGSDAADAFSMIPPEDQAAIRQALIALGPDATREEQINTAHAFAPAIPLLLIIAFVIFLAAWLIAYFRATAPAKGKTKPKPISWPKLKPKPPEPLTDEPPPIPGRECREHGIPCFPCPHSLPVTWPAQLPRPASAMVIRSRKNTGEVVADDRGVAQAQLRDEIRANQDAARDPDPKVRAGARVPQPCDVNRDNDPNGIYDAHHIIPIYLGGVDSRENLCALETELHQKGHPKLDNQLAHLFEYEQCGYCTASLSRHCADQEYDIE
jgi:hypothetical protein